MLLDDHDIPALQPRDQIALHVVAAVARAVEIPQPHLHAINLQQVLVQRGKEPVVHPAGDRVGHRQPNSVNLNAYVMPLFHTLPYKTSNKVTFRHLLRRRGMR